MPVSFGSSVPNWKALRYGKYEPRGISCNITLKTFQNILKNVNLIHKRGFDDYQSSTTLSENKDKFATNNLLYCYEALFSTYSLLY